VAVARMALVAVARMALVALPRGMGPATDRAAMAPVVPSVLRQVEARRAQRSNSRVVQGAQKSRGQPQVPAAAEPPRVVQGKAARTLGARVRPVVRGRAPRAMAAAAFSA
jgi:hypothetical protein